MSRTISTSLGNKRPDDVVGSLTYTSYFTQRYVHRMSAKAAAAIFSNAEAMEKRYQEDLARGELS